MPSSITVLCFIGTVVICLVRAHKRGRSLLGWGLFAFFLWPVALLATWFVGPKKRVPASTPPMPSAPSATSTPDVAPAATLSNLVTAVKSSQSLSPAAPVIANPSLRAAVAAPDTTIVDVTGPNIALRFQPSASVPEPVRATPLPDSLASPDYSYDMPRLGTQYRKKLSLTTQQVDWLDKFWPPHNVFLAIKGCCIATIRLYLRALPELEAELLRRGTSLTQHVAQAQQQSIQMRKAVPNPYGYSWSEYDERYVREQTEAILYSTIFRRCENLVRETYGNKRKLAAEFSGLDSTLAAEVEEQIGSPLDALLPPLGITISAPDEATELALNAQNVARWKQQLAQLATQLSGSTTLAFVAGVNQLGQHNALNPAVENIFFEASKLMAKYDREQALRFYLQYVHHDLKSVTINNKPLAKTIQKSLFPQAEQLQRFEALVSQLTQDKNLAQALDQVPTVYARQRRKVELDLGAIRQVRSQHAGTVELLNEYLQDEPEPEVLQVPAPWPAETSVEAALDEEIQLTLAPAAPLSPSSTATSSGFATTWGLTATQQALLALFAAQELVLPQAQVEAFAREHRALRNQLIDSINEQCYEQLDDVLIEEDGDTYTIYESYYQQLAAPC